MLLALRETLAAFLLHPATYMAVQAWLLVLAAWWAYYAWRWSEQARLWFVPAGGLVLTHAAALLVSGVVLSGPGRYAPWWLIRAPQVLGAYFLFWAWTLLIPPEREIEIYRGLFAVLSLVGLPGSLALHTLGPSRWAALDTGWLFLGLVLSLSAFGLAWAKRPGHAPWLMLSAALLSIGFAADLFSPQEQRVSVRLAELAIYPLLLWWPELFSPWRTALQQWQQQVTRQENRIQNLNEQLQSLENEMHALRAADASLLAPQHDWCALRGHPFWQAFADTLHLVHATLQQLSTASTWRNLPPQQRNALLRLEAIAHFHRKALEVATYFNGDEPSWAPWGQIWNLVLQELSTFAQSRDQTLVLALPDEIFTWEAPEMPAAQALYFVLARALWVSPPNAEVVIQGQVVQMEPGGLGVLLEITERGPVLSEDEQVRIFFTAESTSPPPEQATTLGVNLGLRLARRLLKALHGGLWVSAHPKGRGNVLTVLIPTRRSAHEDAASGASLPAPTDAAATTPATG